MSKKWIIIWDAGYGRNYEVVEAETQEEADKAAYEAWREETENNSDYKSIPLTEENAHDYGLEDEIEEA
jgi:hypothetical protein